VRPSLPLLALAALTGPARADDKVDFAREVRPLLAARCFACHGPDDNARKGKLRLDSRDAALKGGRSGDPAFTPGSPDKSELLARVTSDVEQRAMPPSKAGKRLSPKEIDTLRRWVAQGAEYAPHWAYARPIRRPLPAVKDAAWPRNGVDHFILGRLEKEGLRPTPEADRYALARRVALDLTGLPPTPADADAFVNDRAPDAYEKYVDKLLASPAYGERWATPWLDLARYADSQGFANDPDRTIWRWRDWVIQALNDDMPFDQFTIEQLAGDLLPHPTTAQLVATGFHRNTLTNTEGGTNPEEFRSAAVVDRVNTTMSVWLGTTLACAQCHNHKYDPFAQKEYYQLYAVLNNCEDANGGNDAPTISAARIGMEKDFADLSDRLADRRPRFDAMTRQQDAKQAEWEKGVDPKTLPKDVADILARPPGQRDAKQKERLATHHRSLSPDWKALDAEVRDLTGKLAQVSTSTPILREGKPRPTNVHIRGNFLDKGEAVQAGLPAAFDTPAPPGPLNRLALAKWLVSPDHPLTARVAVNRLWEEVFGVGIVETSEDFGIQGEPPSHPELLDWLATEYIRLGWDTKKMLKLLVTSAAYRQGAQASPELLRRDPHNRLLARGPRVRLSAEMVRDQALFASGLLSRKMYGPPVQPPKPNFGLTAAFGGSTDWQPSPGEDSHRRALYTRVRRNAPYPSLTTFDAPERTYCNVRRLRTNTPLQALVTLNDPVFFEAAQALGRRMLREGGDSVNSRITHGFRLVLTRPPTDKEVERLAALYEQARDHYGKDRKKAEALATKPIGPPPPGADVVDLAAWSVVANVLLNLDETFAKR
jgi:mono/diheme cytochrome c family protein